MAARDGVRVFRNDDDGYLAWLARHPDGFILNISTSLNRNEARIHRAECWTVRGRNPRGGKWTWPYQKVCGVTAVALDQWVADRVGASITPCGSCRPGGAGPGPRSVRQIKSAETVPGSSGRFLVDGPTPGNPVVQLWADDYIRHEDHCAWRKSLRGEINRLCDQLEPSADQKLHATFFGPMHPRSDVENLVLYNIGTFPTAGRNGIRFEYGDVVPSAPDGVDYPYCYRYALEAR